MSSDKVERFEVSKRPEVERRVRAALMVLPIFERYFIEGYYPFRMETADREG